MRRTLLPLLGWTLGITACDEKGREWMETAGETEPQVQACMGLPEAFARHIASIAYDAGTLRTGGGLEVTNLGDEPVCIDAWYVYISDESQDAAAGDVSLAQDAAAVLTVAAGETLTFIYGASGDGLTMGTNPWWCVEKSQLTAGTTNFYFYGSEVPEPLYYWMVTPTDEDSDSHEDHSDIESSYYHTNEVVWSYMQDNPVFIVGREYNWMEIPAGSSSTVILVVQNMGRHAGSVAFSETVPAGMLASEFSQDPYEVIDNEDGSITYWFAIKLMEATESPAVTGPTIYAADRVSYSLSVSAGLPAGRVQIVAPQAIWSIDGYETLHAQGSVLQVDVLK